MTNNLDTLNDILFEQLRRLNNPELKGEALEREINRTDAMVTATKPIIASGELMLRAAVARDEKLGAYQGALPKVLQSGDGNGKKNLHR